MNKKLIIIVLVACAIFGVAMIINTISASPVTVEPNTWQYVGDIPRDEGIYKITDGNTTCYLVHSTTETLDCNF